MDLGGLNYQFELSIVRIKENHARIQKVLSNFDNVFCVCPFFNLVDERIQIPL